jgi:phage tail sheath gpL-like
MGDISFNTIPADVRVPGVLTEVDSSRALSGAQLKEWKVLMIGQRLAAGTVAQLVPKSVTSVDQARLWFGNGSMLHGMCSTYLLNKRVTDLTVVAIDDNGAGVAATLSVVVGATSAAAGTIAIYIGGYRATAGVAAGASAATIAAALNTAINAIDGCPVTSGVVSATLTLTARHKGVAGNEIDVRHSYYDGEALPSGVTLSNVPGNLAGGTTNPLITPAFGVLGEEHFDLVISAYNDTANVAALDSELATRWDVSRQIECSGVTGKNAVASTLITYGQALNTKFVSTLGIEGMVDPPWEAAAAYGAVRSFYSRSDPARPLRGLVLEGLLAPAADTQPSFLERDALYRNGITPVVVTVDGKVSLERTVTHYRLNAAGAADTAFLDTTTVDSLSYLRWSLRTRLLLRFARHKVVGNDVRVGAGQAVATPNIVRSECIALFEDWLSLVLVEDIEQFKRDLIVQINGSDPTRIDILLPVNVANPLYVVAAQIQFRL